MPAHIVFTDRSHGDLRVDERPAILEARRAAIAPAPWTWLRQVHGNRVVVVDGPGREAGACADAAVTAAPGTVLAVTVADCAPIALVGTNCAVGAVHAGWRGLLDGVVDRAVDALRALGAGDVEAHVGPCVHPSCYEFGADDLARLAERLGPAVVARTPTGAPALDLPAAVRAALERAGARVVSVDATCTACSDAHWSYRARRDTARQALAVWWTP